MFEGFNHATVEFYEKIKQDNQKATFLELETQYEEGVRRPLENLYYELAGFFEKYDPDLVADKRRCISTAYNDARFSKDNPIKEYFYLRFRVHTNEKKNILGFFLDASTDGYRYGLTIYHMDARGMGKVREKLLSNERKATRLIKEFNQQDKLHVCGEKFKKEHYAEKNDILQDWLERKQVAFVYESKLDDTFFSRELLLELEEMYGQMKELYHLLKEALISK